MDDAYQQFIVYRIYWETFRAIFREMQERVLFMICVVLELITIRQERRWFWGIRKVISIQAG